MASAATSAAPSNSTASKLQCKMVPTSKEGIVQAAKFLHIGGLVAFPTETVYGLGANALNQKAVAGIFEAKARPLTDPVIVHVPSVESALELIELDDAGAKMFHRLTKAFWPGPLTLIAKAKASVPTADILSAGSGFIGVRCPQHPVALKLLRESKLPIAAPSANRFGHVSPTCSAHVVADLGHCPIIIIDETDDGKATAIAAGETAPPRPVTASSKLCCKVGIESTVCKIDSKNKSLIVFRRGGVSTEAIAKALITDTGAATYTITVLNKTASTKKHQQAPGQMLTHYAPNVSTFMVTDNTAATAVDSAPEPLSRSVIVDCGGALKWTKGLALAYRDLSARNSMDEAAANVFAALRWAEDVKGAAYILLVDVSSSSSNNSKAHEHTDAVRDRMFRAASGRRVVLCRKSNTFVTREFVSAAPLSHDHSAGPSPLATPSPPDHSVGLAPDAVTATTTH